MSYQVLARKYRPRTFREMIGQEHVLKALINALDHNRLHHAYLFTGTRGVGKTTIARILAKCLNCETGVSSEPCGECSACREISDGRFIDLIEVDAASRTKVEDTRELLDNVQYAPTRGRYKIYLIDEVHMLSNHSFNALLKTLEEPPEHIKFLLATTDPQKLPVTILSRCLQFNLKNMNPERIVHHLRNVLDKEMVPFDEPGLWQLARSADGSMRDALSLTDQAIAYGGGKIAENEVSTMLGTIDHQLIQKLMQALVDSNGQLILEAVAEFAEHAPDFHAALADLLTLLHRIAIAQALPEALDNSYGDREQILQFASQLPAEDIQLFYQTALIGRRDLSLAPDPRSGFEMTLLRMLAFRPQGVADVPSQPLPKAGDLPLTLPGSPVGSDSSGTAERSEEPPAKKHQAEPPLSELSGGAATIPAAPPTRELPIQSSQVGASSPGMPADTTIDFGDLAADAANAEAAMALGDMDEKTDAEWVSKHAVFQEEVFEEAVSQEEVPPWEDAVASPPPVVAKIAAQAAPEPESAKLSPRVDLQPAQNSTGKPAPRLSLDTLEPAHWQQLFEGLAIKGLLSATVANCVLVGRQENQLFFALDEHKGSLFDNSHSQRLADMLSDYFGQPVKVQMELAPLPEGAETPSMYQDRRRRERHSAAVQTLRDDPVVQQLERDFGGQLQENSVTFVD